MDLRVAYFGVLSCVELFVAHCCFVTYVDLCCIAWICVWHWVVTMTGGKRLLSVAVVGVLLR